MRKSIAGAAVIATVVCLSAPAALAAPGGERPGWGKGDSSHDHEDGPPGLNIEGENERPGNGKGDQNHVHEDGPPGNPA